MPRSSAETREHVLGVAHELFYWHGIRATGVDRVAVAAGVAPTTLYRLFASKDDLIGAYIERADGLYREWFDALVAAGYEVAGKDPLAVFLTQLSRSPVVRRGTQSGVYELDPGAPRRLRDRLDALHAELRGIAGTPSATADLTAIRGRRAALTTQITQVEKALEEAEALLGPRVAAGPAGPAPVAAAG